MNETIQQQIVSEYLNKKVSHKEALKVIESDFAGLIVFIGNLKEFRKAKNIAEEPKTYITKLNSHYRHGAFLKN